MAYILHRDGDPNNLDLENLIEIAEASELSGYQAHVFAILTSEASFDGLLFGLADDTALELITKHAAMIDNREKRNFQPLATARSIIEAEAVQAIRDEAVCADIDAAIEERANDEKDTARLDWLQSQSQSYGQGWLVRRRSQGGVAVHESARDVTAPSLREAIDVAMKEGI